MINVENGLTLACGNREEIFADISSIASSVSEYLQSNLSLPKEKAREKILLAIERGFLISEKMDSKTAYEMQKLTKKINEKVGN